MIIITNYIRVLSKYAVFSGRATRSEFWWFWLAHVIVLFALAILTAVTGEPNSESSLLPLVLYWFGTIIPFLALIVRRFHDRGYSGWMVLLGLIPFIGGIIVLIFMALPGDEWDNRHGPYPRRAEA